MSLTAEQREKAEKAIRSKKIQDILKRHALERRNRCIEDVSFYDLPFRVLYSLRQPREQIKLNRFYPFRAASAETEEKIREALRVEREKSREISEERRDEIRISIESIDYTPSDQREYYFTCFLSGWDFSSFRIWDWTGDNIPQPEADRLRRYYTERQGLYEDHPERFAQPALKSDDNMKRYSEKTKELIGLLDNIHDLPE